MNAIKSVLMLCNAVSFVSYVGAVFVFGTAGVLLPRLELQYLLGLDFAALTPEDQAAVVSILHPYRFLKALNVGLGVFAVLFVREIYTNRTFNRFFLGVILAGALARVLSLVVDGIPNQTLFWFTILEFLFLLSMFGYSRFTLAASESNRLELQHGGQAGN